jgi:hypothetical protein
VGIGVSILLIAIGAILTFAVDVSISGLKLEVVGWILMGAGVVGLIITLIQLSSTRRTTVSERRVFDPNDPTGGVVEQQRTTDDGPPPPMR